MIPVRDTTLASPTSFNSFKVIATYTLLSAAFHSLEFLHGHCLRSHAAFATSSHHLLLCNMTVQRRLVMADAHVSTECAGEAVRLGSRLTNRSDLGRCTNCWMLFRHKLSRVGRGSFRSVPLQVSLNPGVVGNVFVVFNFLLVE